MNLDKNTVTGFVLLGILFILFFWYSNKEQKAFAEIEQRKQDSIARINALKAIPADPIAAKKDSLYRDSVSRVSVAGDFVEILFALGATAGFAGFFMLSPLNQNQRLIERAICSLNCTTGCCTMLYVAVASCYRSFAAFA